MSKLQHQVYAIATTCAKSSTKFNSPLFPLFLCLCRGCHVIRNACCIVMPLAALLCLGHSRKCMCYTQLACLCSGIPSHMDSLEVYNMEMGPTSLLLLALNISWLAMNISWLAECRWGWGELPPGSLRAWESWGTAWLEERCQAAWLLGLHVN